MPADPDTPKIITLAEGRWVRQEIDNLAWIDLGGWAVVVDALEHAEKANEVFAAIERHGTGAPVRYVLNTHTHYDHVALNGAFHERGAEIINQQTCPLPAEGRWFEGPRRRLLMQPMPGCHTEEDCIVWLPGEKVLFTGDIFGWGLIPLTRRLTDATVGHVLATCARLIDLGAETVVPGHGPLCETATLERYVAYVRWLVARAREGVAAGRTDAEIAEATPPPPDMRSWWRFVAWKHADSRDKVLHAVRAGELRAI